jgi:hypothetical protein
MQAGEGAKKREFAVQSEYAIKSPAEAGPLQPNKSY